MTWRDNNAFSVVLVFAALLFAIVAGGMVAQESVLPVLVAIALLGISLFAWSPSLGLCISYPIIFLVPYNVLRIDFPLFHSPLNLVTTLTLAFGIARFVLVQRRSLPRSPVYGPMAVCIIVLVAYAILGHGEAAPFRLLRFVQGMWPFIFMVLLVTTPSQVRYVLIAAIGSLVALSGLLLSGLVIGGSRLSLLGIGWGEVRSVSAYDLGALAPATSVLNSLNNTFIIGAIAMVGPVLFSLVMTANFPHRGKIALAAFIVAAAVLLSTFSAGIAGLLVGGLFLLAIRRVSPLQYSTIAILIAAIALLMTLLPGSTYGIGRLLNPTRDISGTYRLMSIQQGFLAFLESPLVGHGASTLLRNSPKGFLLDRHSSYIPYAFEFGLIFLVPLTWLLVAIGREFVRLMRRVQRPLEKALARGMFASFIAAIAMGFLTPVLGEPMQDTIFWLFIGISTVWNGWLDHDSEAVLIA